MKKLTGLDEKLIAIWDETTPETVQKMPTFRVGFLMALGQGQSKTADESRLSLRALRKIRKDGDAELQDEEFKVLRDRLEANVPGFVTSIHGQLLEKLDEAHA